MEILLTDKITVQPVCLVQGESRATTLAFTLPARHSGCPLDTLAWQVRATNQKTLAFMADTPVRHTAAGGCFTLVWQVSGHFTRQAGPLLVTLVGSTPAAGTDGIAPEPPSADAGGVVAKFVVEGIAVAPCPDGDGEAPAQGYFEVALLQTGQNAALALENSTLATQSAAAAQADAKRPYPAPNRPPKAPPPPPKVLRACRPPCMTQAVPPKIFLPC